MSDWKTIIADFRLTPTELQDKYDPDIFEDKGHPVFPWWDWFQIVAQKRTRKGYWEWVHEKLDEAEYELDRTNPYNVEAP